MKKKILPLLVAMCATTALLANGIEINGIHYLLDSDTAVVTYMGNGYYYSGNITIPSTVTYQSQTYRVTGIGDYTFSYDTKLVSVTIPNSVTSIGILAFQGCSSLTSITIPNSVTSIGYGAFCGCTSLASITVDAGNTNYCSVDDVLFNYATSELIQYPTGHSRMSYSIPSSVISIGTQAFADCAYLSSVTIPNSVTSIEDEAFERCTSLVSINVDNANKFYSSVDGVLYNYAKNTLIKCPIGKMCTVYTIPNSVTSIEDEAFSGCTSLTSVTIPNSITSIGVCAFYDVANIMYSGSATSIYCDEYWGAKYLNGFVEGNLVYEDATKTHLVATPDIQSITIPNTVKLIVDRAFSQCSKNLIDIYCQAVNPPYAVDVFAGNVSKHCRIHVPAGSVWAYQKAEGWKEFYQIIEMGSIPASQTEVGVTVTNNYATFSWPVNPTASSYTLEIKKGGVLFCTLVFNNMGQLVGMSFAPGRGANQASAAESNGYGYSFVVTGLSPYTTYNYTFTTLDGQGNILETKNGTFETAEITAIENISSFPSEEERGEASKLIKNGILLIDRNGVFYNVQGAIVEW